MDSLHLLFSVVLIDFGDLLEFLLLGGKIALTVGGIGVLLHQLLIGSQALRGQFSAVQGCLNGAARFLLMGAVGKTALLCQFFNIPKCLHHTIGAVPHSELTHTGRINHHSAVR